MRRVTVVLLACMAALGIAACGSSGSAGAPANPRIAALSYFPPTTPFVLTLNTNPKSASVRQAQALEHSNPTYAFAATALFAKLAQLKINYDQDIRPLFGNPIAIGAVGAPGAGVESSFLATWVTRSAAKLTTLIHKLHALKSTGAHDGAQLYSGSGVAVATAGPTLILARSVQGIDAALDRHAGNQGIDSAQYSSATSGVDPNGLVEIFGDLTNVLATPKVAMARQVPWVAAIRGYAVSVSASPAAATFRFHVDTSGKPLSASQLPIASGTTAPGLAGTAPIEAAVRDPAQVVEFIESVMRETQPAAYAKFRRQQSQLRRKSGFNFNALAGMLTGDLNVESDTQDTIARAQLSDPAEARAMLAKLATAEATGASHRKAELRSLGGGLYSTSVSGKDVTLGVVGDQLVIGRATPAALQAFAAAPAASATTSAGAVTFQISIPQLLQIALRNHANPAEAQALSMLGDLTGSATATTSGLSGSATLAHR